MAISTPPKDALALGQHLVHELGLIESTDTLARWIAHEIAEAIARAEDGKTVKERSVARREATHLITTLWEHRAQLPGKAYPLAGLREVLRVLSLFTEDLSRAWWGYSRDDQVEAALFHAFAHLMPCLLVLRAPATGEFPARGSAGYDHLEKDEQAICDALRTWIERLPPPEASNTSRGKSGSREGTARRSSRKQPATQERSTVNPRDLESELRASALAAVSEMERGLVAIRTRLQAPSTEIAR